MIIKKVKWSLIAILFCTSAYNAQIVGVSFMLGLPQGAFKQNVDRLGYGFQLHGTFWSPSKARPFTLGLDIGYMVYGEETEHRPFSYYSPDVTVEVNRTNSLANLHVLFQVAPFTGTVRPYLEGLFGGAYIFTTTKIESEYSDNEIAQSTNYDDFTWSYGGGAGLLIQLKKDMGDVKILFLDLKVRYIYGTEATYLTEGGVSVNSQNGTVTLYPVKSKTDLININIGVTAYF